MSINVKHPLQVFYGTSAQDCHYIPSKKEKKIITQITGPDANKLNFLLSIAGFRRSHKTAYRPACNSCDACVPVRINVKNYFPNRSQKRTCHYKCLYKNKRPYRSRNGSINRCLCGSSYYL